MDPYAIQAINPFILKGFVEPQIVVKSEGMNPPKMPRTPKTEGAPTTRSIQAAVTFLLSPKSLGRSQNS